MTIPRCSFIVTITYIFCHLSRFLTEVNPFPYLDREVGWDSARVLAYNVQRSRIAFSKRGSQPKGVGKDLVVKRLG